MRPEALAQPENPVKIWPLVILAAIKCNQGGAARVWFVARSLDEKGGGSVEKQALLDRLAYLGVGGRKRRRWTRAALSLGLMREHDGVCYLASLANGSILLGCVRVGDPALVNGFNLVINGWRAHVWAAFNATLNERPISQKAKAEMTEVDPRTQRNYQKAVKGSARKNYAQTKIKGDHLTGLREHGRQSAFVGKDGFIYYRLPDQREVPGFVAKPMPRGRSRKAQKKINFLYSVVQEHDFCMRLFHETYDSVKTALRDLARVHLPPDERPREAYILTYSGKHTNLWQPISAGEVALT